MPKFIRYTPLVEPEGPGKQHRSKSSLSLFSSFVYWAIILILGATSVVFWRRSIAHQSSGICLPNDRVFCEHSLFPSDKRERHFGSLTKPLLGLHITQPPQSTQSVTKMCSTTRDSGQVGRNIKAPLQRKLTKPGPISTDVTLPSLSAQISPHPSQRRGTCNHPAVCEIPKSKTCTFPVTWISPYANTNLDSIQRIPKSDAARLVNKTEPIPGEPGNYIVALNVFHELHCLVS